MAATLHNFLHKHTFVMFALPPKRWIDTVSQRFSACSETLVVGDARVPTQCTVPPDYVYSRVCCKSRDRDRTGRRSRI